MSGRIVYEPLPPTGCERGMCEGKPKPENYRDGTIWQCDDCCAQWEKCYNEPFDAWRLKGGARVFDDISIRADGMSALIHETEIVICDCGHTALAHHGLDARERRDAGCQTNAMRDDWCRCVKTCQMVMEEQ